MIHPLKITSTLADETRFQIYEYMLQQKKLFNVQEIADRFEIHPNVARLHLTKLTEINCISAEFVKTGKGGRPGRVYRAKDEAVELSFPRRDTSMMLEWLIETVHALGEIGIQKGKDIAFRYGQQTITNKLPNVHLASLEERIELLKDQAVLIGYVATVEQFKEDIHILFHVYNCPFHSLLVKHAELVCTFHESFLHGQVHALFGDVTFEQKFNMLHECTECQYAISNVKVRK